MRVGVRGRRVPAGFAGAVSDPYAAIIPGRGEIGNLLVLMMMSASHVAYSSIRMEATYMVMGESAGIATVR